MTPRLMLPGDRGYVFKSWLRECAYRPRRDRAGIVTRHLDTARTVVLATGPTVHAFACGSEGLLHFAYVPHVMRGLGIGRRVITALLGAYPEHITVTHPWPVESARFVYARKEVAA